MPSKNQLLAKIQQLLTGSASLKLLNLGDNTVILARLKKLSVTQLKTFIEILEEEQAKTKKFQREMEENERLLSHLMDQLKIAEAHFQKSFLALKESQSNKDENAKKAALLKELDEM